jgi:hypothetical protein
MNKPLSQEELESQLCNYCPLDESAKGVHCYGGEPVMCIDSGCCVQAYENYLEEFEEENKEMDNLEKAQAAYKLSQKVKEHEENIKELKNRLDYNKQGEKASINFYCYSNSCVQIEADEELINTLILSEHCRLEKATKELDDLLNGDVKKLKECLEDIGNEQQDSRE